MNKTLLFTIHLSLFFYVSTYSIRIYAAKKPQSIFFNLPANFDCKDSVFNITANSTSRLPVNFTLVSGNGLLLPTGKLIPRNTGLFIIKASQAGNEEYDSAFTISRAVFVSSQFPTVDFSKDLIIPSPLCIGDSASFSISKNNGAKYQWNLGDNSSAIGSSIYIPLITNQLSLTGSVLLKDGGCEIGSYQFKPIVFEKETITNDFIPNEAISGDTLILATPKPNGIYVGTNISGSTWIVPFSKEEKLQYTYNDSNNCKITLEKTVEITRNKGETLAIYEYVTPNGDGLNDQVFIKDLAKFEVNELTVYNRWGNIIFRKKNYQNDWTPTELQQDVYYYELKIDNSRLTFRGSIYVSN